MDGACELIQATYQAYGRNNRGLFRVTMFPSFPETGYAWAGFGFAYMFTGITAPLEEFAHLEQSLLSSIRSFQLKEEYINFCLQAQEITTAAIIARGLLLNDFGVSEGPAPE